MKKLGIIGGFGPDTTVEFYQEIITNCQNLGANSTPHINIVSAPMSNADGADIILRGKCSEQILEELLSAAKNLATIGSEFLVLPCNTLHIHIDRIRNSVNIPILSIIEETVKFLKQNDIKKVGIVATTATIHNKLYEDVLNKQGIETEIPNDNDQKTINELIHQLVYNKHTSQSVGELINVIQRLRERSCDHILLACTDLQLIANNTEVIYDTMKILADAAAREMMAA